MGEYFICEPIPGDLNAIMTESGLITKTKIPDEVHRGIVRFMGTTPAEFEEVEIGMIVAYTLKAPIPITVPGYDKDLVRCRWRNLLFAYNQTISDEELARRIASQEDLQKDISDKFDQFRHYQS